MPISIHPKIGQILLCDFDGFKEPEMVKPKRPVIVISGEIKVRVGLVTVVPLSTVKPDPVQDFHYMLPRHSMPMLGNFQDSDSWVKGDMLYTVGFHRLNLIRLGTKNAAGKRLYFQNRLGREQMREIYKCILSGLNLSKLSPYSIFQS